MTRNSFPYRLLAALTATTLLLPLVTRAAEDIDIYAGVDSKGGKPNVLFFIDNTSNWSANNQAWKKADITTQCNALSGDAKTLCLKYRDDIFGSENSLVQGQVELRALKLVLNELVCKTGSKMSINAGIMLLNDAGTVDSPSGIGGYIRHRIAPLDTSYCATITGDLDNMDAKISTPDFKGPSSADYGTALFEAFKYFGGWTNPAGARTATAGTPVGATGFGPVRYTKKIALEDPAAFTDANKTTYQSPIGGSDVCGNNYIVLIGNKFPNQEYGSDTNASPPSNTNLTTRLGYNHGAQFYPVPLANSDKSNVRFADEWAKFLVNADVSDIPGQQNIRMFTVDVFNGSPDAEQGKLLKSMADQTGTGGYFSVNGNLYNLVKAFTDILTQIAAVDSVFASASLPVSVNAQGTFLNQVFMGVFRPDENAQQRWVGNLKQYKFKLDGSTLSLVGQDDEDVVDAANTGFLKPCARSFWSTNSSGYWQNITGYNEPSGCDPANNTAPFSDLPDGPFVERGGAAQRLRLGGYSARNLRTCSTSSCPVPLIDLAGSTVLSTTTLRDWVRGQNTGDGYYSATASGTNYSVETGYGLANTTTRPTVHGGVLHSRPLAVNYGTSTNDVVVFYGADDGVLRAVNGNQTDTAGGDELWGFVAPEHWSKLDRVRTNVPLVKYPNVSDVAGIPLPQPKSHFFDGQIGGYQERDAGGVVTKLWIYPTMRRGGNAVYAFNVTQKPSTTNQPTLLWRYSNTSGDARMGQSWSTPTIIRVKGITQPLAVFGAGYDSCEDNEDANTSCSAVTAGKGIVIVDAEAGASVAARYRFIGVETGGLDSSAGRFVADITAVDIDRDGYTDVLYAVDTRGNIWRVNTTNPTTQAAEVMANWKVTKIATVSQWGGDVTERRKFMYAPSVVALGTQVTVLVGTGDREKPSDGSSAANTKNRFYGVRDDITQTTITPAIGYGAGATDTSTATDNMLNVTSLSTLDPTTLANVRGWFRDLSTTAVPYEQVVTTPVTLAGVTYFNTYQAKDSNSNTCTNLGTGRAYQINFQTGLPPTNEPLVTTFVTEGIPPSPVGGLVMVDNKTVPFIIGGPGKTPISPAKITPKVSPDRRPVYRFRRID